MAGRFPFWSLVKRELLANLRNWRSFACLASFLAVFILCALATLPGQVDRFQGAARASRELTSVIAHVLFWACVLFVPAFAAATIASEKERGTFDQLKLTLVRPMGIVVGKFLNTVGFFLLLIVASMPVLSVSFFMVGLNPGELIAIFLLVLATACACAMAGVLASALFSRTYYAIAASYIGVMLLMAGPIYLAFLGILLTALFFNLDSISWVMQTCAIAGIPFYTLQVLLAQDLEFIQFVASLAYQLAFTAVCAYFTMSVLKRPPKPVVVRNIKPIDSAEVLDRRRKQFPYYLIDPMRRKKAIEDRRNPMLVKELRWGLMSRATIMIRVFYSAFLIYFFVGAGAMMFSHRNFDTMQRWVLTQIIVTVCFAPALLANVFTKEYELGNMDMLRMTLLRSRSIVVGKGVAGLIAMSPLIFAAMFSCIPVLWMAPGEWRLVLTGYGTLFVCSLLSLSMGVYASLLTRNTTVALALSYGFSLIVFLGMRVVAEALWHNVVVGNGEHILDPVLAPAFLSPIAAFAENCQEFSRNSLISPYWATNVLVFFAIACIFLLCSVVRFQRVKMRDV